jgi:5-bromo-4-chloroindolyl phosphate hydrolysis protein
MDNNYKYIAERLDKLENKIDRLSNEMAKGKGIFSFIAWVGSIAAVIAGYFYSR